jgi:pimeloyl-ACP methyl ester carboxylesterase
MSTPHPAPSRHQIAKLQSFITLSTLVFWWALAFWLWPQRPVLALLCVLAPWLITALIVAVQFVMLSVVGRGDAAARPGLLELLRAWAFEVWSCWKVFQWHQPFRSQSRPDFLPANAQRGVVLIHGFFCNRGLWVHWMDTLRAQGRAHVAVNLEPAFGSIDAYAATVEAAVRQLEQATGQAPVLVGHSMGGLAARAWLASASGNAARLHRVVTLGTPHRGTWLGQLSHTVNGQQMREHSNYLQNLAQRMTSDAHSKFVCFYSNCDNIVFPISNATLQNADNRLQAGWGHLALVFAQPVQNQVWELFE